MKKFAELNRKGFTLIEVIVVAAIIAILAGILVPMIFNQIDESKKARATGDIKGIHTAIVAFQGAAKKNPVYFDVADCTKIASFLYSEGTAVEGTALIPWVTGGDDYKFTDRLNNVPAATIPATTCYNNTSPINLLTENPADPWGNRYSANSSALATPGAPVWIISAGPNGVLDTDDNSPTLNNNPKNGAGTGDDIGIRWQ